MRILVISHEFPPVGGGGGRAAYDICKELAAKKHEIVYLTAHMRGLAKREQVDGFTLIRIPSLRTEAFRASIISMLAFVIVGFFSSLRLIQNFRVDVIHAHFAVPAGALAFFLSKITGIPYVITAHLGDVPGGVPEKTDDWFRWIKPFTNLIWNHASQITAVSEHTRRLALQHYNVPVQVVHNGVDVAALAPKNIAIHQPVRFVFAGRLVEQKNPLAIINILAQLKDLPWTCSMLGDGPLMTAVKQLVQQHGLQDRLNLRGWVTPEEVLAEFENSDILFMPSLSEGLPVVGVQALAKGLALVVSEIGGFLDLVENDKNGFLIPVHDEALFAQKLHLLLKNPQMLLQFRQKSLQKAKEFDIHFVAGQYEQDFEKVVEESAAKK